MMDEITTHTTTRVENKPLPDLIKAIEYHRKKLAEATLVPSMIELCPEHFFAVSVAFPRKKSESNYPDYKGIEIRHTVSGKCYLCEKLKGGVGNGPESES